MRYTSLSQEKAFIWRIVHRDNLPWIFEHGLHCGNSPQKSNHWVNIGSNELITKRSTREIPCHPYGSLNDYVPFYFTPFSVMMKNIHSGRGVPQRANEEIVILVSSMSYIQKADLPFVFTDSHAYSSIANFYNNLNDLDKIDWTILQNRDFKRDPDNPEKFERYQAEALIYRHVPLHCLLGAICYTDQEKEKIQQLVHSKNLGNTFEVHTRKEWYF